MSNVVKIKRSLFAHIYFILNPIFKLKMGNAYTGPRCIVSVLHNIILWSFEKKLKSDIWDRTLYDQKRMKKLNLVLILDI